MPEGDLPPTIGRFRVVAEIGRGTMGIVYKAHDPVMDRLLAVKVVHLAFAVSDAQRAELEERFLSEARIVARLSHPNIVVAYDVGLAGPSGPPYIALEYLTGRTLARTLAEGPPDWREALRLAARLARALHYAHARGVVHRDVKPANVMVLPDGEPKLMDFGLARLSSALARGVTGPMVGTPLYMSPEQALGGAVDARSDLFSLGSLAYTLLTGRRAFEAERVPRILHRVIHEEPARPTRVNPSLPSAVDYLLQRALAKPPGARYPDGGTMADDFEDVLDLRPPRHRAGWVPPPAVGEQTVDSPRGAGRVVSRSSVPDEGAAELALRPAPREGEDTPLDLRAPAGAAGGPDLVGERELSGRARETAGRAGAAARDAPAAAPAEPAAVSRRPSGPARHAHASLALLVASMLAFGAALVLSPFWRQQLAERLGVGAGRAPAGASSSTPGPAVAAALPPSPGAPLAPPAGDGSAAGPAPDAGAQPPAVEGSPAETAREASPGPGDGPSPGAAGEPASTDDATAAGASVETHEAGTAAAASAAPSPAAGAADSSGQSPVPAPAAASPATTPADDQVKAEAKPAPPKRGPAPRASARLRIAVTHDLKSGRLKVMIDGRTVVDEALRARRKRYLLFFKRREGALETRLPVVPGRRRITVQVRSGSRLHAEDLRETFAAGATRQLNLRVSGGDGLSFDWE